MNAKKTKNGKVKVDCPRCCGSGYISGFSHVCNGVCFRCKGEKFILVDDIEEILPEMSEYQVKVAEWIMNATAEQFEKLTWKQLQKARNFCHWRFPRYPDLFKVWQERGESIFMAEQERQLAAFYENRK